MYERSAIVLERYMEKVLELNKNHNLKKNNENYGELIHEIENYQVMTGKELKVIQEFDDTAKRIESLQQEQERLYKINRKLEDERAQLFSDLGEDTKTLESKLKKIEKALEKNNGRLIEIRKGFIQYLSVFLQKQKNRNKCEKTRRIGEANHIDYIEKINTDFSEIDVKDVVDLKDFVTSEKELVKQEALDIMIKNGKNERVAFQQDVLKKAIKSRIDIAEKEAECYVLVYDRMKKLLAETDSECIKLSKYKKVLRDTTVKLAFLKAEKEYIVGFLDYERMTAISGTRAHKKMMIEACNNFELDMIQIKNLYELILKEIAGKATKKVYKELYNKTYLRNIEDKEKNFEKEVNNVNISMGTVINSNYWRIEGIKNIYNVFQEEVSEKFEKDLSEYKLEEIEEEDDYQEEEEKHIIQEEEKEDYQEYEKEPYNNINIENQDQKNIYESITYDNNQYNEDLYDNDDEYEDISYEDEYEEKDEHEDISYEEEEPVFKEQNRKQRETVFDDEDSIDEIIEKSRKKASKGKHHKEEENKGLFNKLFKKDA